MPTSQLPTVALVSIAAGFSIFLFMLYFYLVSRKEEEPQAAKKALMVAFLLPSPYLAAGLVKSEVQTILCFMLLGITALGLVILLLPIGNSFRSDDEFPITRIDERDIMFSRRLLEAGSDRFIAYYDQYPERKPLDDRFRKQPGLLEKEAKFFEPFSFAAADASFKTVAAFHTMLDDEKLSTPSQLVDPIHMSRFIKEWALRLGTVSVGITELKDYHLYHTIGRGDQYGEPVKLNHRYAIAITVEMDKYFLDRAPKGLTVMESARQYLNSGAMAVQLAEFIRQLGYSSRAHIDGSYRVVCPLVARDAGLGEIGRMGLLMTPELGPRVRLAVVTTDLPLIPDGRKRDKTVIDFCRLCKKCADVCPPRAIPFDDRSEINGVLRWQINAESCFTYWCKIGTDCGQCMRVCPYSHPNNTFHNVVRGGVKRSRLFRMLALKLDDFFYGYKPAPLELPDWIGNEVD